MFGLLTFFVLAQNLSTPLSDYQYQIGQYQTSYSDYLNKKNIFSQYHDLSSEQDKNEATKIAITNRQLLLKSYLVLLSSNLEKYKSSSIDDTTKIQNDISSQINNLDNFNYTNLQVLFYQALTQHQINRRLFLLDLYLKLAQTLNAKTIVDNQTPSIVQSLSEVKKISLKPLLSDRFKDFYPDVQSKLTETDDLLNLIYKNLTQIAVKTN
jgi:hypothetical protein